MTQPQRIQLRRTAGWRKPDDAVAVARPSRWSNPFRLRKVPRKDRYDIVTVEHGPDGDAYKVWKRDLPKADAHIAAVELFELHIGPMGNYEYDERTWALLVKTLTGRDLACWCSPDLACHADVLLRVVNDPAVVGNDRGGAPAPA